MQSVLFNPDTKSTQFGGVELLQLWQQQPDSILWVDLLDYEENEERPILESFGFHPLAIQDALRKRHPPKIESYNDHVFLLLRGLLTSEKNLESSFFPLSIFVKDRLLVTRHSKESDSINGLYEKIKEQPELIMAGPAALALRIADRLFRRYVRLLIEFEPRLDSLEAEMFAKPNDELLSEITSYKSRLRHITRNANYHKLITMTLRDEPPAFFNQDLSHESIDLYEQVERSQSLSSLYYDVLKDLSDGYLALSSHRLNRVMQILTVITVIFVPLTFVAGLYGMNFEYIPELSFRPAYFVVLGFMALAAIVQLILFRRKGWL